MFRAWPTSSQTQRLADEDDDSQLTKASPKVNPATPRSPKGASLGVVRKSSMDRVTTALGWQTKYAQAQDEPDDPVDSHASADTAKGTGKTPKTPTETAAQPRKEVTMDPEAIRRQLEEELMLERRPMKKPASENPWPSKVKSRGRSFDGEEAQFAADPWSSGLQQKEPSDKRKVKSGSASVEVLGFETGSSGKSVFEAVSGWPPMPTAGATPGKAPAGEQPALPKAVQGWPMTKAAQPEQPRTAPLGTQSPELATTKAAMPAWPSPETSSGALASSATTLGSPPASWPSPTAVSPPQAAATLGSSASGWPAPAAPLSSMSASTSTWPAPMPMPETSAASMGWGSPQSSQSPGQAFPVSSASSPNGSGAGSPGHTKLGVPAEEEPAAIPDQGQEVPVSDFNGDAQSPDDPEPARAESSPEIGHAAAEPVPSPGQFDEAILAALAALPHDSLVSVLTRLAAKRPAEVAIAFGGASRIPNGK